jgi:ribosomal protein L6P/L9E
MKSIEGLQVRLKIIYQQYNSYWQKVYILNRNYSKKLSNKFNIVSELLVKLLKCDKLWVTGLSDRVVVEFRGVLIFLKKF